MAFLVVRPLLAQTAAGGNADEFFESRIRPLLAQNCFACHTNSKMGGLQLDSSAGLKKGGVDGAVVVPGNPDASILIQAVRYTHQRLKMPPAAKLTDGQVDDLAAWVKMGAPWPGSPAEKSISALSGEYVIRRDQRAFWSFQPIRKPSIPPVADGTWPRNDIDRMILAKLEEKGLRPVRPADKRTLIRRATLDLIGLPPTPEEVDAFLADASADAFARVVDRLLASLHYGERWGRHWLDAARYADEKFEFAKGQGDYQNAFRYRDWVIQAFNDDMPYDVFVKAQIAADLLPAEGRDKLLPGLGLYGVGPGDAEDRVDVTTRTFLGMTVACARCHNHKYDPVPAKDYYSLIGIFRSTDYSEIPLAPDAEVKEYQRIKDQIKKQKREIDDFIEKHLTELGELLATKTAQYMVSAWNVMRGVVPSAEEAATNDKLDLETLNRCIRYLKTGEREHAYLKQWDAAVARGGSAEEIKKVAEDFQAALLSVFVEKREIDDRNYVTLGGAAGSKDGTKRQNTNLESLAIEKYYLWRDFASLPYNRDSNTVKFVGGLYFYTGDKLDRWLAGEWGDRLRTMRARLKELETQLPPQYPFLHAVKESSKPENAKIEIRGDASNLGEEAPRRFLQILSKEPARIYRTGSGRLELAEAIASADNPLTARVMVNRVWAMHFGHGIARTPSNFGQMGDRPSHPELLDYLATRFIENHWSVKKLHREIMLSATYQLSSDDSVPNLAQDSDNRLFWRANRTERLDIEALRDCVLAVAGNLDLSVGGPAAKLTSDNRRRTVYGHVSRNKLDPTLLLFDFPDPNTTSESRNLTLGPLQSLYFMNSEFIDTEAKVLAARLDREATDDAERITRAYRLLYAREPAASEIAIGIDFLGKTQGAWQRYAQGLLSSSEFSSVN